MVARALATVLGNWRYAALATLAALLVFALATWLPNFGLLYSVLADPRAPLAAKLLLPLSLLGSIATNFTVLSAFSTVAIAILAGVNAALAAYQIHRQRAFSGGSAGVGALGIISGALGVGCAACGSLILTALLGVSGAGALAFLPLRGGEFGLLGVALLTAATYLLARRVARPLTCEVR